MKLKMYFSNEQDKHKAGIGLRGLIRRAVLATLAYEGFTYDSEVSVTFTDNEGIRELNREHREKDRATDVLSFPMYDMKNGDMPEEGYPCELGDIVLSLERAGEQAEEFGHSFKREVAFLTVHSTLHLLGYDHELSDEDDADMRRRQKAVMEILKISRD